MATVPTSPRSTTITLASVTAGPFLLAFRLFDANGLEVLVNGIVRTDWTLNATFVGGFTDAASITFTATLVVSDVIMINGAQVPSRGLNYVNPDPNLTGKLNLELARLWAGMQELKRNSDRSVRSTTALNPLSPVAGRAIIFDASLNPIAGPNASEIANAQANAAAALLDANRAEAAALTIPLGRAVVADLAAVTTAQLAIGSVVDVLKTGGRYEAVSSGGLFNYTGTGGRRLKPISYDLYADDAGAMRDGVTDDSGAINALIEYSRLNGERPIRFREGQYLVQSPLAPTADFFGLQFIGDGSIATEIFADHSAGPVIRLNRSVSRVEGMTIRGSAARKEGAAGTGLNKNVGIMQAAADIAARATASCDVIDVKVIDQPNSGFFIGSLSMLSTFRKCVAESNLGHGYQFDIGTDLGYVNNLVYTGLTSLDQCWGLKNGGHGLVIGNPLDLTDTPTRHMMTNCEWSENATDAAVRFTEDEVWTRGENITFNMNAFGRASGAMTGAVRFAGRLLTLLNCRYIRVLHVVRLQDDPVTADTTGVLIDGHRIVGNAVNPAVIHDGVQLKGGVAINSYGQSANITKAFQDGLHSATWNRETLGPQQVRKVAAQSVTSSTTLVDDLHLKLFLRDSRRYSFEAQIRYTGAATGDLKLAFTIPAGATVRWDNVGSTFVNLSDVVTVSNSELSSGATRAFGCGSATRQISVRGVIIMGATAGNLQLQFAQNTSDPAATTILDESFIRVSQENAGN
jgi:hypothetical protein